MRIAGSTMRRNYLNNYESARQAKFESEVKIETNRQYTRGSQDPIKAARALRVRKALSELNTYTTNLKSANSIYATAEASLDGEGGISEQIATVYQKLVEGAHGTRNPSDCTIIAMEIEQIAEQMVGLMNVASANRKIFGGTNNETVCYEIKGNETGKYVTYNGVAVNSSSDPNSFPYSEMSYLDIGIGMTTDESTRMTPMFGASSERIEDQTALPITFNGAKVLGCGVTGQNVKIDLEYLAPGVNYAMNVSLGGIQKRVEFNGGDNVAQSIENINKALSEQFQLTPEVDADGNILYLENREDLDTGIYNYDNATINGKAIDLSSIDSDSYYSLTVTISGKTRVIDFKGGDEDDKGSNINSTLDNIRKALDEKFGEGTLNVYSDGRIFDKNDVYAEISNTSDYSNDVNIDATSGKIDMTKLEANKTYTLSIHDVKVTFTAGATPEASMLSINKALSAPTAFGKSNVPHIENDSGLLIYDLDGVDAIYVSDAGGEGQLEYQEMGGYSNNIIQIVLDAAKALRDYDQDLVARLADNLYAAQSSLSIAIAELGTNDQFIDFNLDRIQDIDLNLSDQQNELEYTDIPTEITRWKLLESIYNATLQMGSQMIPMSIFNYIN
ncbi:MAG: hypothetical protein NC084_07690 [Bacteroides sp.]|nr:hypothetical protein [Eubacterium sp.]MCM1418540.1 hypothetical protein [Roseburia sp.]MCM1462578.1 hypothetical protein [Bacteroides sp.]